MNEQEFKRRTKRMALRVMNVVEALPDSATGKVIGRQLLRSATSVGANYRAACRAKSEADMIAKLGIVEEEGDETLYWLELLVESGTMSETRLSGLVEEVNEIVAMTVSSIRTLREKDSRKSKVQNPKSKMEQ